MKRYGRYLSALFLTALSTTALAVTIFASNAPYSSLPALQGINAFSMFELRNAALTQAAGTYRSLHGPSSLPAGSTYTMVYQDGSQEQAMVDSTASSLGVVPIPGTQQAAPGGGGGGAIGGGGSGGGGSGGGGGGFCPGSCGTGTGGGGGIVIVHPPTHNP